MALQFRTLVRWLVPAWFNRDDQAKVNQVQALMLDAHSQRLRDGITQRFPSYAGDEALALIGSDRGIIRGRSETKARYAARLKAWRWPRGHRTRGSAFALLEQFSDYWSGLPVWSLDASGNRHDRDVDGDESYSYGNSWTWDAVSGWARFWLVLDATGLLMAQLDWGDADLWGGDWGVSDYTWGQQGATSDDVRAVRRLVTGKRPWRPAGTQPEWMIVSFDGTTPTPDATWEHWSQNVAGTQTATRSASYRYWSLAPAWNNTYAGDPTNFPDDTYIVDGTTEAGDPTSFPSSATLPRSGSSYAGDPTSFPASVQLLDDGDPP